jgi:hypothetical protein
MSFLGVVLKLKEHRPRLVVIVIMDGDVFMWNIIYETEIMAMVLTKNLDKIMISFAKEDSLWYYSS